MFVSHFNYSIWCLKDPLLWKFHFTANFYWYVFLCVFFKLDLNPCIAFASLCLHSCHISHIFCDIKTVGMITKAMPSPASPWRRGRLWEADWRSTGKHSVRSKMRKWATEKRCGMTSGQNYKSNYVVLKTKQQSEGFSFSVFSCQILTFPYQ